MGREEGRWVRGLEVKGGPVHHIEGYTKVHQYTHKP